MRTCAVFCACAVNGGHHNRALSTASVGLPGATSTNSQTVHRLCENSESKKLSLEATQNPSGGNLELLRVDGDAGRKQHAPEQVERVTYPHERDLIYILVQDIRNARAEEWLVDQPRLVVDMLYKLPDLQSVEEGARTVALQEEAHELLLLISERSFESPRTLCRSLASAARVRATPPQHMLDAVYAALRGGLRNFNLQNTVGQSGLLTCLARLYPGSSRFDKDLDVALQRILHLQTTQRVTARQHSTLLWALARIGFQSSTVETIISNCCTAIAQETNLELRQGRHTTKLPADSANEQIGSRTEWQEEEELVKAAGFDLSWLPGGAPEHFVMLQAPLSARLTAGRFIDMHSALTSSSDLLEASTEHASADFSSASEVVDSRQGIAPVDTGAVTANQSQLDSVRETADTPAEHALAAPEHQRHSVNATQQRGTDAESCLEGGVEKNTSESQEADVHRHSIGPHAAPEVLQFSDLKTQGSQQHLEELQVENQPSHRRAAVREGTFVRKHGQQTLSNTVWALAVFDAEGLKGVQDAIVACCQLFCAMQPEDVYLQVVSNMAWASNHHGLQKVSVLHHTVACVKQLRQQGSILNGRVKPQSVSNILYAMAEARYRDDESVRILTEWAAQRIHLFNDQERANLAWACARLNCSNSAVFKALRPHVFDYVAKSEAWLKGLHDTVVPKQRVASMCAVLGQYLWSHSLLGHVDAELFQRICRPLNMLEQIRIKSMSEASPLPQSAATRCKYLNPRGTGTLEYLGETILTQVATAWMSLEVMGDLPDIDIAAEEGAEEGSHELVEHALAVMRREAHETSISHSAVHDSICEVLHVLGAKYKRNVLLENELLCIQTLVGHDGAEPVAIIPNRGHDLTITRPLEVVGNAAWQATQLRARGVRVVEVNGDSWRHLSRRERAAHLQRLLSPFAVH